MKLYSVIFFSLLTLRGFGQTADHVVEISPATKRIVQSISRYQSVNADTMGLRFGYIPKDDELTLLRETVSIDELKELTNHKNVVVRCFAFKALTMVSEPDSYDVVVRHLDDLESVATTYGCIGETELAGDFFINVYKGREAKTHDATHVKRLDSLLIFIPNKLEARIGAFRGIEPDEKYYNRVREVATQEKVSGALIALAKFQKEEDIDLIMTTRVGDKQYSDPLIANYKSIQEFHHPVFIPFLKTHLQTELKASPTNSCFFLYSAIVSYDNEASKQLLLLPNKIKDADLRSKHLKELSEARRYNVWLRERNAAAMKK